MANRGSEEMMSCVLKHFQLNKPSSPDLIVFSDNCGGQNKNWNFIAFWIMLVNEGLYKSIEHRFPLPGHTRMPCDKVFGIIKNHKKKVLEEYTPEGWAQVIRDANRKNPFNVTMMTREEFFCFDNLANYVVKKTKTDDKEPLNFMKARCFKFTCDDQNVVYVKHGINEKFKTVTVFKAGHDSSSFCRNQIYPKYRSNISLNANKISDLRELLPYIPPNHWLFSRIFWRM